MPRSKTKKRKDYRKKSKIRRKSNRRRTYRRRNKSNKKKRGGTLVAEGLGGAAVLAALGTGAYKWKKKKDQKKYSELMSQIINSTPTAPFSNTENFEAEEEEYMNRLQEISKEKDKLYFPNKNGKVSIKVADKKLKNILNDEDKNTIVKHILPNSVYKTRKMMETPDIPYDSRGIPRVAMLQHSIRTLKDEIPEYVESSLTNPHDSAYVSFSLLKCGDIGSISTSDKKNVSVDEISSLLRPTYEKVKEMEIFLHWRSIYGTGINKVLNNIPNKKEEYNKGLPLTISAADISRMYRYYIPEISRYMHGIVDGRGIKVYVNLNQYELQNQFKEYVFKIACHSDDCMYFWIPVIDYSTPIMEQLQYWVHLCKFCREQQLRMLFHCGSGVGRSIFMTFCNLLYMIRLEEIECNIEENTILDKLISLSKIVKSCLDKGLLRRTYIEFLEQEPIWPILKDLFGDGDKLSFIKSILTDEFLGVSDQDTPDSRRDRNLLKERLEMAVKLIQSMPEYTDYNFDPRMSQTELDEWLIHRRPDTI